MVTSVGRKLQSQTVGAIEAVIAGALAPQPCVHCNGTAQVVEAAQPLDIQVGLEVVDGAAGRLGVVVAVNQPGLVGLHCQRELDGCIGL